MDPQRFCVRWNSYKSNLQTAFPKLLTSEHFVDVTLACEKQFIKCHKIVLSACSVYFETLLVNNPCQHPIIFMKDVEFWEIKALVEFMYKGEVNVSQNQLDSLLKSAESLQIRGLSGTKQFVNFDNSDDSREECVSESKSKRSKSDNEDEDEGVKRRKRKPDEDDKYVQITSVKHEDSTPAKEKVHEDSQNDQDMVVKEEVIDQEDYDYESTCLDPREDGEDTEGFTQDAFYDQNNAMPGPSGMSDSASVDRGPSILLKKEDPNYRRLEPGGVQKSADQQDPLRLKTQKQSARRSCYKQYTMANMWAALERIEQGLSVYRASLEYGVPRKTLRNWMKKYNIMSYFDLRKQEREKHDVVLNLDYPIN